MQTQAHLLLAYLLLLHKSHLGLAVSLLILAAVWNISGTVFA